MSSKPKTEYRMSLALRLSIGYGLVFALSSVAAFALFYSLVAADMRRAMDAELHEDFQELSALLQEEGLAGFEKEVAAEVAGDGAEQVYFRLVSADGAVRVDSGGAAWRGLRSPAATRQRLNEQAGPLLETVTLSDAAQAARVIYGGLSDGGLLQIGESLAEQDAFLSLLRNGFVMLVPPVLLLAGLLGGFMARQASRGVVEVSRAAAAIAEGDMDRRVPLTRRRDEIDQLARTFNGMLDRIQALLRGMREMSDNIAHDLRSPLARIRGIAEGALTSPLSLEDCKSVAADTIEECDRLMHLINTMLDITETEAGMVNNTMETVDLSKVIHEACDLFQPLAEDKNITLGWSGEPDAEVFGNVHFLQRMIANLIDNALKYTARGGTVAVVLVRDGDEVSMSVRDTGCGIEAGEIEHVFKRFYRCDQSRSAAGSGLGLSLAAAIARAHGGAIDVHSTPGEGSEFRVRLPGVHAQSAALNTPPAAP